MEDEEAAPAADQIHGKLLESCDGHVPSSNQSDDNGFATVDSTTKSISPVQDFKIDISDPTSTDSPSKRCSSKPARRCLLVLLLIFIIAVASGFFVFIVIRRYSNTLRSVSTQTVVGQIQGRLVSVAVDRLADAPVDVEEYLGIPFALPPVGDLRYADPVPLDRLPKDPYGADAYGPTCMQQSDISQGDFVGTQMWNAKQPHNEDCLYLNVWAPRSSGSNSGGGSNKATNRNSRRAVMVWIYGGAFNSGSSSLWVYDGKALAAFGDVIVVSFNYRVGSLGFLSTGDGRIKGNFGLKDQATALRWVNRNIASFGGDPSLVTLFGESSGAASVGMHQLSTGSASLFTRVIFQSGAPLAHWSFLTQTEARRRSKFLFSAVGCNDDQQSAERLLSCLRNLDSQIIIRNDWVTKQFMAFPWAPTVDGDFLVDTPYNLLVSGRFQRKDALLGANRDEGSYWILPELPGFSRHNSSLQNLTMFRQAVDVITWDLNTDQRRAVLERYEAILGDGDDLAANRDALDRVCGDRSFTCPTSDLADMYSDVGQKIYFYYLTHRATNEQWPPWMGVIHGADIQWIFGMPLNKSRGYTEDEVEFSKVVMRYWTNFAKTGTPNGPGVQLEWPEYSVGKRRYLELRAPNDYVIIDEFRETYCQTWRDVSRQMRLQADAVEQVESSAQSYRRRRRHHRLTDFIRRYSARS